MAVGVLVGRKGPEKGQTLEPLSRNRDSLDWMFLCCEHSFNHTLQSYYSRNSMFVCFNVK